jgi:hypothetical protein
VAASGNVSPDQALSGRDQGSPKKDGHVEKNDTEMGRNGDTEMYRREMGKEKRGIGETWEVTEEVGKLRSCEVALFLTFASSHLRIFVFGRPSLPSLENNVAVIGCH